jgi:hypothetical protein
MSLLDVPIDRLGGSANRTQHVVVVVSELTCFQFLHSTKSLMEFNMAAYGSLSFCVSFIKLLLCPFNVVYESCIHMSSLHSINLLFNSTLMYVLCVLYCTLR